MKSGFTLAEVLITLGIIGVVSAMTIPTLMTNYQTKVWESKLKKGFSIAVNACERMLVEENVSRANETALYAALTGASTANAANAAAQANNTATSSAKQAAQAAADAANSEVTTAINRYFKTLRSSNEVGEIILPDSTIFQLEPNQTNGGFTFWVDVNGPDRPDIAGRDRFEFIINRNCSYVQPANSASVEARRFDEVVENNWGIKEVEDYTAQESSGV